MLYVDVAYGVGSFPGNIMVSSMSGAIAKEVAITALGLQ